MVLWAVRCWRLPVLGPFAGMVSLTGCCDNAIMSLPAVLGAGSPVIAGVIVDTEARLAVGGIANCGAVLDHHAKVADYAHLSVNASTASDRLLERRVWMQVAGLVCEVKVPSSLTFAPDEAMYSKR